MAALELTLISCRPQDTPGAPPLAVVASSPVDEDELVEGLRSGDEDAFAAVVRAHHPALCRLARTFVGSSAVAEEVVQETSLAVVRGVDRFEGRSSLRTWLFHILVNRARTTAARERRADSGFDLYLYLSTNPVDGEESAFDDDHVNLGRLEGNLGDQNDDLPAGTDLSRYATAVIWCDRFNSAFGAADLR